MTAVAVGVFDDLEALPGHPAAFFGPGARHRLPDVLADARPDPDAAASGARLAGGRSRVRRVLLVRGRGSFERCGIAAVVARLDSGIRIEQVVLTAPNPDIDAVRAGVAAARRFDPDIVVGVGGGSAMDLAKLVAVLAGQPGDPSRYLVDAAPLAAHRPPLVLLPTTCGSGSELTQFATAYIGQRKVSLDSELARADLVLVDPELSASVPPPVAAAAGADALCQAIESYWAVAGSTQSRLIAWRSYRIAVAALHAALSSRRRGAADAGPSVMTAELARAAALSGAAINLTRTTAAHALSYGLTGRLGLPHGLAVAVHMRWLLAHNAAVAAGDCRHPAGAATVAGYVADLERACAAVTGGTLSALLGRLLRAGGRPTSLAGLALDPADWAASWAEAIGSDRGRNNPRLVTVADVHGACRRVARDE